MADPEPLSGPEVPLVTRAPSRLSLVPRSEIDATRGYEDVPILKPPVWGWEIANYFFVEGVSSGIYTLETIADLVGVRRRPATATYGRLLAVFAMMPAPVLLILDLGRPERFHHMLRVFKPRSPMNLGTWALTGYALFSTLRALQAVCDNLPRIPFLTAALKKLPARLLGAAGLPFAMTMLSYPGVLLESTSIPAWSHTPFLGPLIAASSLGSGAAAMSLVSECTGDANALKILGRVEDVSAVAESASIAAYVVTASKASRPLTSGAQSRLFWPGAIGLGIVAPAILRRRKSRVGRIAASVLTLAGSFALKWAITHAGRESSQDRELANRNGGRGSRLAGSNAPAVEGRL